MNSQARGRRDESCALDPGEEMAAKGGEGEAVAAFPQCTEMLSLEGCLEMKL